MSLIEALVAVIVLYLSAAILNNNLREEVRISRLIHRISSAVASLVIFGIIISVRLLLESLSHFYILDEIYIFGYLTTDAFLFAIMTTLYLPLHAFFLKYIDKFKSYDENFQSKLSKRFTILSTNLIFLSWVIEIILYLIALFVPESNIVLRRVMVTVGNISFVVALLATIFLPILASFLKRLEGYKLEDDENVIQTKHFKGLYIKFMILAWIVGIIFLSIPLLKIPMTNPDEFNLGFLWAIFVIGFASIITMIVNNIRPIETRVPSTVLKEAMYAGGLISFGIWSIQLVIVELYLSRLLGFTLYNQDIRILIIVVNALYVTFYYYTLKKVFDPKALKKSELKLQEAIEQYDEKQSEELVSGGNGVILDVQDLTTYFYTEEGVVKAVEGVSFKINEGETLGLVGETGCGKSVTALSILQVVRPPGIIEKGKVIFEGEDLLQKSDAEVLECRGKDITMIFQDPLNSLNPVFKIGAQITEVYLLHMETELLVEAARQDKSIFAVAREWSEQLLQALNIPYPEVIFDRYPHELSGGMRQRIQIAMGIACKPKLLIADEPTTALDVTIQNQILKLMKELKTQFNTSMLFITHDLGIISKMCNRVAVMYSGFIIENGDIKKLFTRPYHPYTRGLIGSVPVVGKKRHHLEVIKGSVPNLIYPPSGCRFHPRCNYCFEPCNSEVPKNIEVEPDYFVACHLYDAQYKELAEISIKRVENV
ncbi:MAG: ABC transporter ATP-binding protein [Promethearchaeota archaeon]